MKSARTFITLGAVSGFLSVALGAFAAHGLKDQLTLEMLAIFETGARYQMYHALALLAVAWAYEKSQCNYFRLAGICFVVGTGLFSGSLYLMALTGQRQFGAITPLGGILFLIGWILLLMGSRYLPSSNDQEESQK